MSEQTMGTVIHQEPVNPPEFGFPVEAEYKRCIQELNRSGIISILPHSETLGVVGIDGKEHPMPTTEELQQLFLQNKDLVAEKVGQGFTKLHLVPMSTPTSLLVERAKRVITAHAKTGKIFQTKQKPTDVDVAVGVDLEEPAWTWDTLEQALDTDGLVYFPDSYSASGHNGIVKPDLITNPKLCPVSGWSIGLVEPTIILPREGQAKNIGGRKQLENNSSPQEYLRKLKSYGETGWTPEDFLVHFITTLETTNQVSHDWDDYNTLWLAGSWLPAAGFVPVGYWGRDARRLYLRAYDPGYRVDRWGSRATVRLGL